MTHLATFTAGLLAGCFGAAWLIGWFLSSGRDHRNVADLEAILNKTTTVTFQPLVEGTGYVSYRWPQ